MRRSFFVSLVLATLALAAALAGAGAPSSAQRLQVQALPFLKGQLLVASDKMGDPRFAKTVIYMIDHTAEGAVGLVINKVIGTGRIASLLQGFGYEAEDVPGSISLHSGGPVSIDRSFILHSGDYTAPRSKELGGGVSFSTDAKILFAFGKGEGPKRLLFAVGYAGWGPGQLEGEIAAGAWTSAEASADIIFVWDRKTLWDRISGSGGIRL